jgi:hypothetical protein
MNALLIFSVAPLAVLGAVLITLGYFGWGISLWTIAIALSQASFLADVWAEYKSQGPAGVSLTAAFVTCLRRSA